MGRAFCPGNILMLTRTALPAQSCGRDSARFSECRRESGAAPPHVFETLMRTQTAEFCASCHKVHPGCAVKPLSWVRGFQLSTTTGKRVASRARARARFITRQLHDVRRLPTCARTYQRSRNIDRAFVHSHVFLRQYCRAHGQSRQTQLELSQKILHADSNITVGYLANLPLVMRFLRQPLQKMAGRSCPPPVCSG